MQAHSTDALAVDAKEFVAACLFLGLEALVGWLICSLIVGRMIGTGESVN